MALNGLDTANFLSSEQLEKIEQAVSTLTETDRDNLCDILWWMKGYKKGAAVSLETSDFVQDHMDTLTKVVKVLRGVLNNNSKEKS
jgi:hypothetical protein